MYIYIYSVAAWNTCYCSHSMEKLSAIRITVHLKTAFTYCLCSSTLSDNNVYVT